MTTLDFPLEFVKRHAVTLGDFPVDFAQRVGGAGMGGGVRSGAAPAQNIQIVTFQTITCHLRPAASARELPCVGMTGVHTQRRVCVTQQR